ncbi:MAG TPA: DEAD/DEAH box helicase [Ktedonobacteraceae bacterium]|nr:DEAD/DEAH box helicase [Ktedonobacteraceae bacterium]
MLHALWENVANGKLHLWSESSSAAEVVFEQAERSTEQKKIPTHPFTLSTTDLQEAIGDLGGSLFMQAGEPATLALRLPTRAHVPLPSPQLLFEQIALNEQKVALRWWRIPTLTFSGASALDILLKLPQTPRAGMVYGESLRFWMTAAAFALELLTRQCFVPTLQPVSHGKTTRYHALWRAQLTPEDSARLRHLVRLLPALCWSFLPPGENNTQILQELVGDFLNQVIDAFVREQSTFASLLPTERTARTLPGQWLQALVSHDPVLAASATTVGPFAQELHNWLAQLQPLEATAAFRTCFRLDPPDEETHWQISYHLQATDDPSLLVPAAQVWQERSSVLNFLQHQFENPQERLLADLGRASRLFPLFEESLNVAYPAELFLDTEQAYRFLREAVPLLEQSGFGVLVPPWWQKRSAAMGVRLKFKASAVQSANAFLSMDNLVAYNWDVAIGDTTLSADEFEKLVNLKQPLVQVRGQWVELRPEQIDAAIAFFKKKAARRNMTLRDALHAGLGEEMNEMGLPVLGVEAEGPLKEIFDRLTEQVPLTPITVPPSFQGQLRPYQLKGVSWLAFLTQFGFGACLADDMGMGKTPSLIALLLYIRAQRPTETMAPTLIICPMSIVGNWQRELTRFAPGLSVMVHHGADRLSAEDFVREAQQHMVVITTYALALRDKDVLAALTWEHIVLDEAQNIKNEAAKQTQAIKQLPGLHKIALTGTPVENRLSELWSIMEFLNPGYLNSSGEFRKRFAVPIERYHDAARGETLKQLIQPFVLRRVKTDKAIIKDLPEKMEMKVYCNLTQEQASLYEVVVKDMLDKIENANGIERKGLILAALTQLKQICNHPAQFMHDSSSLPRRSGKLARLDEMLEEVIASGEKALIFTQYAEMGTMLRQYLQEGQGYETLFLHGAVEKKQRDLMVQRFQQERRGAPLFILSLKAGGVGLNLTAANHVFHFDRWWNPAVENQATDRAFRIGQQKNVLVHKFLCVGTLEERIDQMIEQKKELAENIVGSGENWLTEMSTNQLKELFALSREAVV